MKNVKKRNYVIHDFNDKGPIMGTAHRVLLMSNIEAYEYALKKGGDWSVEMYAPKCYPLDILKMASSEGSWYYDNGDRVITLALDIRDEYFSLAESNFSDRVLKNVWKCYKYLLEIGYSEEDIFYFKRKNNRYYLMRDGREMGYLDNTDADRMFKDMLLSIFKEKDIYYEVIVFPTKSLDFFFEDTVVAYETVSDFRVACDSWDILPL